MMVLTAFRVVNLFHADSGPAWLSVGDKHSQHAGLRDNIRVMSDADAVLFANEAFYRAFADRDENAMDALWSDTDQVACLHPGWGPLFGRDVVVESWKAIIRNDDSPEILCHDPHAHVYGDTAYVICFEEILDSFLVATNVFVREGRVWKMVHHQAGPTSAQPETEQGEPAAVN
jgi:hypothetical protein